MPLKNNPVGHHEVDYYLECGHVNKEKIEAAIFVPKVGDTKTCNTCKNSTKIVRVLSPYWVDAEEAP